MRLAAAILSLALLGASPVLAQTLPTAITTDPAPDAKFPARLEVVHVPTGGVKVNGIVFVASGAGPHPTVVLFHGLPGNEKNYDLAQSIRRAGWNVLSINYRGSWGSPGRFHFAQNLEDAKAALAFARDPANAKTYGFDPTRLVVIGHSMGGWVSAETLAADDKLLGGITISAGDMGFVGLGAKMSHKLVADAMNEDRETLVDATGDNMADELAAHGAQWSFAAIAPQLVNRRLLVLYSNDFVKAHSVGLINAVQKAGGKLIDTGYADTDHSWNDHRIELQVRVLNWLAALPGAK